MEIFTFQLTGSNRAMLREERAWGYPTNARFKRSLSWAGSLSKGFKTEESRSRPWSWTTYMAGMGFSVSAWTIAKPLVVVILIPLAIGMGIVINERVHYGKEFSAGEYQSPQ